MGAVGVLVLTVDAVRLGNVFGCGGGGHIIIEGLREAFKREHSVRNCADDSLAVSIVCKSQLPDVAGVGGVNGVDHFALDSIVGRGDLCVVLGVLTEVVLDGLEGGVGAYAPIIVADLVADIHCGKSCAEGDVYTVLVKVSGGAVAKMSNAADVAQIVEKDVVPALAGLRLVKIERTLFCVKIILHN